MRMTFCADEERSMHREPGALDIGKSEELRLTCAEVVAHLEEELHAEKQQERNGKDKQLMELCKRAMSVLDTLEAEQCSTSARSNSTGEMIEDIPDFELLPHESAYSEAEAVVLRSKCLQLSKELRSWLQTYKGPCVGGNDASSSWDSSSRERFFMPISPSRSRSASPSKSKLILTRPVRKNVDLSTPSKVSPNRDNFGSFFNAVGVSTKKLPSPVLSSSPNRQSKECSPVTPSSSTAESRKDAATESKFLDENVLSIAVEKALLAANASRLCREIEAYQGPFVGGNGESPSRASPFRERSFVPVAPSRIGSDSPSKRGLILSPPVRSISTPSKLSPNHDDIGFAVHATGVRSNVLPSKMTPTHDDIGFVGHATGVRSNVLPPKLLPNHDDIGFVGHAAGVRSNGLPSKMSPNHDEIGFAVHETGVRSNVLPSKMTQNHDDIGFDGHAIGVRPNVLPVPVLSSSSVPDSAALGCIPWCLELRRVIASF